jgi:hypothetical protein
MSLRSPRLFSRLWLASATAFTLLALRGPALAANGATGTPVEAARAWWLLLPLALVVGCWLWLNSREEVIATPVVTLNALTTPPPPVTHRAEAAGREGVVCVHERPEATAPVLREIRNGGIFRITGARRKDATREDWLEVSDGGWVRDDQARYDRYLVR